MADVNPTAREDESIVVNLDEPEESPPQGGEGRSATDVNAKPPPVPGPGSSPAKPQEGLEELQRQMAAERQERVRVTQIAQTIANERDQAIAFAQEAERRGVSQYELYTESQIKAAEDRMASLAAAAEQSMHDGDFKRVAALNLELGRVGGDLAVLKRDQAVLQQQREQMTTQARRPAPQQQPQQPQQQRQQPTDPVERAIQGRTEPTKNFIRKHPEIVRGDGTLKRNALDAHERALDEGFQVDTPGYFEYIERSLVAQQPQNGGGNPASVARAGAPTMAAPVARNGAPGGGGSGGNTFVATPKMRRLAEEQGVPIQEWVRNYVRLLNEGRITPIT